MTLTYNDETLNNLGVQVDDHLLFSNHIDKIARKITSNIWLLSRIKNLLNKEHRVQFYKSLIQPHLDYCNIVWGNTSQNNLLKIMTIYKRIFFRKAKFMYKVSNSLTPSNINDMFNRRQPHQRTSSEVIHHM